MSCTQTFLVKNNEPPSVAITLSRTAISAITRTGPKQAGEPSLSPFEAARDELEKFVAHTMPDDPEGDFA